MIILQISPEFSPGTGVGGVAHALEEQWRSRGHDVRRFGPAEAGCAFLAEPKPGLRGKFRHAARVIWFSTIGTVRARRATYSLPADAVTICHNDALAGDVYVNHGVLATAMRARGHFAWRMARNPLHLFTASRDSFRYRSHTHRIVVSLSQSDRQTLVEAGLAPERAHVIPNGVELDKFRPATETERRKARDDLDIPEHARVAVFVGHEFDRKGLPLLLDAVEGLHDHHVVIVGGTSAQISARRQSLPPEVTPRVHWVGRVPDPRGVLGAADVLVLPSAYEANPLVVLEALASGLQVVATRVGSIPEMLSNDEVSQVVERSVAGVREGLLTLSRVAVPRALLQAEARSRVEDASWDIVAERYLELFEGLRAERRGQP